MIYLTREYYCIGVGLIGTSLSHLPAIHYIYYQLSTTYQLHTYNSLHIYLLPTTYCLLLPSATYYLLPITATCHLLPAAYYIPTIYNLQPSSHMTAQHKRKPCHHAFRPIVRLYGLYIHLPSSSVMMHQIIFWPPGYVRHCYLFTTFSRLILLSLSGSKVAACTSSAPPIRQSLPRTHFSLRTF